MDGLASQIGRRFQAEIAAFPRGGGVLRRICDVVRPINRFAVHIPPIMVLRTIVGAAATFESSAPAPKLNSPLIEMRTDYTGYA